MRGLGFYDEYFKLMGNLKDKPDLDTPYKIKYLKVQLNFILTTSNKCIILNLREIFNYKIGDGYNGKSIH